MADNAAAEILPPLTEEDKMLCGLSYPAWFVIPGFVLFSHKKQDPFLCFHALQGLMFGGFSVLATLVLILATWVLFQVIPHAGGTFSGLMGAGLFVGCTIAFLSIFVVYVFLGWQASSGQFLRLPLIGELAETKMATMLDLDLDELRRAAVPRETSVQVKNETIPFPDANRLDPQAVKTYATQMIKQADAASRSPQSPPPKEKPVWPRASGDQPGGGGRRW